MPQPPNALRRALLDHFEALGFARATPPILQPAEVFFDQAGEEIRGRLYLTGDADGGELCLRPEFTVPVCRDYLASPRAGEPADFCYLGPVFRLRPGEASGEFLQSGVESFGREDVEAADADILGAAASACAGAGAGALSISLGDAALFSAFLDRLELPPSQARRLRNGLAQGRPIETLLTAPAGDSMRDHSGVLAALAGADKPGARALVEDLLSIAGISTVGGRSANEIAERFLEQAGQNGDGALAADKRAPLADFLKVGGDPDTALSSMRAIARAAGIDLTAELDRFGARIDFIAAQGLDPASMQYVSALSARVNYYTGFVFEGRLPGAAADKPVLRGGRYDALLRSLGAARPIPAVGAAIWLERLPSGAAI